MDVPGIGAVTERLRVMNNELSVLPIKYGKILSVALSGLRHLNWPALCFARTS